jgi:acyl-CoA synthetase (AMP-forming)/AMP-acid ligase II
MMPNSPEWLFVHFATQKLGAYAVPLNVGLKGEGLRHTIDHSDSRLLVCHPDYADAIQAVCGPLPRLEQIVVNTAEAPQEWRPPEGWRTLAEVMEAADANPACSCLPLFHANALFLTTIRIVDGEGEDVAAGEPGEFLFQVADAERRKVEYYKNEEASNAKIHDGWLHTGDLVYADQDGHLHFVDRKTDSLRRRGENISSWEIERENDRQPVVLESAALGVPSDLGEDEMMGAVVLKEGETLAPGDLIRHCEERMAGFTVPPCVGFRDALPKTGTHRIQCPGKRGGRREGGQEHPAEDSRLRESAERWPDRRKK